MLSEYFGYLILMLFGLTLASSFTLLGVLLGPKRRSAVKDMPFESGMQYSPSRKNVQVKFYLAAMVFLIFDVEVAFLYPYALKIRDYGWQGFAVVMLFLTILSVGILYEWKKRILYWD